MGKLLRQNLFLAVFLAMVAIYVIVCTPAYGQSAIGEARKYYFMFFFPLLALISVRSAEDLGRLFLAVVCGAGCIAVVALKGIVIGGSIVRVLDSGATLFVALVALGILVQRIYGVVIVNPVVDKTLLWLFFIIVLGSGQRSVWLGFGVGLILTFCLYIRRLVLVSKIFMLAIVMVMGLATAMIVFPQAGARIVEKFGGVVDPYSDATASWRIENWQANWNTVKENILFGDGLGSYYSWKIRGKWDTKIMPHNGYLQMMLKFGLFGLIIYLLLVVQFFRRTLRLRKKLEAGAMKAYVDMGILTFAATHAFILGYAIEPISLVFVGIAITAATLSQYSVQASRIPVRAVRNDLGMVSEGFPTQRSRQTIHP
jgi:O-antigen ligase